MTTKIRSLEDLEALLLEELKWRKQELSQWYQIASKARKHELNGVLRGGSALLYAHWEGYVKEAARGYLEYVDRQGLTVSQLRPELAAVALRGVLGRGEQSKQARDHTELVEMVRDLNGIRAMIPHERSTIKTNQNLRFATFVDVMHSIGCDGERHKLFQKLIDVRLVENRHAIVHGREVVVQLDDWVEIREKVLRILDDVRTQVSNAAASKAFMA